MKTWSERISDWAVRTFGKASPEKSLGRFEDELEEFYDALDANEPAKAAEEAADMVVTLCNWARSNGFDLAHQVYRKEYVNERRNWFAHGDGTGKHIKSPERDEHSKRVFDERWATPAGRMSIVAGEKNISSVDSGYRCSCGANYQLRTVSAGVLMCADCMAGIP